MDDLLIRRVIRRAENPKTRTDLGNNTAIFAPISDAEILSAEAALGFSLPEALKQLYLRVGNGGFGPGYGVLGIGSGARDDMGEDVIGAYTVFAERDTHNEQWEWPVGLIRLCHWGCAIYSCVDCLSDDAPVVLWDPNNYLEGNAPTMAMAQEAPSLEDWIRRWSDGDNLWDSIAALITQMPPPRGRETP